MHDRSSAVFKPSTGHRSGLPNCQYSSSRSGHAMHQWWKWTRNSAVLGTVWMLVPGCNSVGKHDNPVLQPPPRRVTMDDSEVETRIAAAEEPDSKIRQTSAAISATDDTRVFNALVVAKVNGAPVFAGEVLDRYAQYLQKAREKLSPEEFAELREAIIRRDLRSHIERRLLVERMKSKLKPEQITMVNGHIDRMFEPRVEELKKEMNVSTRTELELALNERGTSLATVKDAFATERMAMEFLFSSIERPDPPTRPEMVAYYQEHINDYKVPARVKWQQIQVSVGRKYTKSQAEAQMGKAQEELNGGADFAAVARKYSDGPTASSGGEWDWTRSGSLADQQVEKLLYELPVGQVSEPQFSRGAYHLVKVLDRQSEGRTPFADVQAAIEEKMQQEREKDLPKQFVDKLYSEAIIETDYDYLEPQ